VGRSIDIKRAFSCLSGGTRLVACGGLPDSHDPAGHRPANALALVSWRVGRASESAIAGLLGWPSLKGSVDDIVIASWGEHASLRKDFSGPLELMTQLDHGRAPPQKSGMGRFPNTPWTLIARMASQDETQVGAAFELICRSYWSPLYAFLRRLGYNAHDSEDLTQSYFVQLIEKKTLECVSQDSGRLRSFLLADLKFHLANYRRAEQRQKRGGGRQIISIQGEEAEKRVAAQLEDPSLTPERAYDRAWVLALLTHVLEELKADYVRLGKGALFEELKPFIVEGAEAESYASSAATLGMLEGTVRVNVHRLRVRYREHLLQAISQTVDGTPQDLQSELSHLMSAVQ
jgi:RNA polymerase sigma factor (sigma-70 family)